MSEPVLVSKQRLFLVTLRGYFRDVGWVSEQGKDMPCKISWQIQLKHCEPPLGSNIKVSSWGFLAI